MDKEKLIAKRNELIRTVEAIDAVLRNKDWQILRDTFEGLAESIESQLLSAAKEKELDTKKIYFLQGQLATAKRYDLAVYAEMCKKELEGIKRNLQQ